MTAPIASEWVIETQLPVSFKIKSSPGILDPKNGDLLEYGSRGANARRFVVIDRHICQWYLGKVTDYFKARDVAVHIQAIDATEDDKNLDSLLTILRELEKFGILRRDEPVIAIGGGVLLDVVGMAAGMYRRGIPYIRVPTTLVGLVDASVGAKTGINFETRRNRLGSYYPPIAAYLDRTFLRTLDPLEISSGLGEILKMAVIKDARLFELLERSGKQLVETKFECADADEVINRAVLGMKVELQHNLWEKDLKRIVDYGHSFSPIVEMRSITEKGLVPLTHGQAVTLDVIYSCVLSAARGMLPVEDARRVIAVAHAMNLPTSHSLFGEPLILLEALRDTMKHRNGDQNLPFPVRIGEATFVNDLSFAEMRAGVPKMQELARQVTVR